MNKEDGYSLGYKPSNYKEIHLDIGITVIQSTLNEKTGVRTIDEIELKEISIVNYDKNKK